MSPDSAAAMRGGIDLGGTKIQTAIVDAANEVVAEARRPTPQEGGPAAIAAAMAESLGESADAVGVEAASLKGVGVGSPGDVSTAAGTVANAGNLSDWTDPFPLAADLAKALGNDRVAIGNDVSVAVRGEAELGAGVGHDSILGVFWGTGVGGGIVLNGSDWAGRGAAGEIGHMVVERDGALCPCGNRGCMEAYAGRGAMEAKARKEHEDGTKTKLFHLMKEHDKDRLTSGIWERAIEHDDKLAIHLIERAVKALGAGIASAVNLLDPEIVILGGGLGVRFGDRYGPEIEERMGLNLFDHDDPPEFKVAELGDLGGAIGAALLVA